uniref:DUF4283 domain-containing protein n=1 Tax=Cannabis sativa TaxID=3483 RepID=A0A803Q8D7_CANSA
MRIVKQPFARTGGGVPTTVWWLAGLLYSSWDPFLVSQGFENPVSYKRVSFLVLGPTSFHDRALFPNIPCYLLDLAVENLGLSFFPNEDKDVEVEGWLEVPVSGKKNKDLCFLFPLRKGSEVCYGFQTWTPYKGFMLVTPMPMSGKWADADLTSFLIWVRLMDVPTKFLNDDAVLSMANRVRVSLQKPILAGFTLLGEGEKKVWSYLKYDKLLSLCYKSGVIGHEDSGCSGRKRMVILDDGRSIPLYGEGSCIENSFALLDKEDIQERKRLEEEEAEYVTKNLDGKGEPLDKKGSNEAAEEEEEAPKERAHTESVAHMAKIFKKAFGDTIFGSTKGSIPKGSKRKAKTRRTNLKQVGPKGIPKTPIFGGKDEGDSQRVGAKRKKTSHESSGPKSNMTHGGESRDRGNNFEAQEEGGCQECRKRPCVGDTGMRNDIELQTVKTSLGSEEGSSKTPNKDQDFIVTEEAGLIMPPSFHEDPVLELQRLGEACYSQGSPYGDSEAERNRIKVLFGADDPYPPWIGAFVYAPPRREDRKKFWTEYIEEVVHWDSLWILMGDLNSIVNLEEKTGGRQFTLSEGQGLRDFIFNTGCIDLEATRALYTWTNGQDLVGLGKEKLDRALGSVDWYTLFAKAGVKNLPYMEFRSLCGHPGYSDGLQSQRWIAENSILAQEIMFDFRKKRDILSRLILCLEREGSILLYVASRNGHEISHLMYADDTMIFVKAEVNCVQKVQECLEKYCAWILKYPLARGDELFLGNPLMLRGTKKKDFQFVVDKVVKRLEGWKAKILSQAGRTVLIKQVVQSIPLYTMATFKLLVGICDELDKVTKRFWWTRGMEDKKFLALKSWDAIYKPTCCGRLGIRRFQDINFCLLAKLAWAFASKKSSLWIKVLDAKYCNLKSYWSSSIPSNASKMANDLWSYRNFFRGNYRWLLGNNSRMNLWTEPWGNEEWRDGAAFNPIVATEL